MQQKLQKYLPVGLNTLCQVYEQHSSELISLLYLFLTQLPVLCREIWLPM